MVVFVPGMLPGETAEVQVVKKTQRFWVGEQLRLCEPSPERVAPPCPYFGRCGGCSLQHLSYEGQLKYKQRWVCETLRRLGGITCPVRPIIGGEPWRYRSKAQLPVGGKPDTPEIGYYKTGTHDVVDISECALQQTECAPILAIIKEFIKEFRAPELRHILLRSHAGKQSVTLVTNGPTLPKAAIIAERLMALEQVQGVALWCHNIITLAGEPSLNVTVAGNVFTVSPASFLQVNPTQAEKLYACAVEAAGANMPNAKAADLYCGIGTITLALANKCKHVTGVEALPQAVDDAQTAAKKNGISNVGFICADAADYIKHSTEKFDIFVLNPPRIGCKGALIKTIKTLAPPRIIYISCNPATLARDLALLCNDETYSVHYVQPLDMFPQTTHVETIMVLQRRDT